MKFVNILLTTSLDIVWIELQELNFGRVSHLNFQKFSGEAPRTCRSGFAFPMQNSSDAPAITFN